MKFISDLILGCFQKRYCFDKKHYIFYKIVDSVKSHIFKLQCINTNAIFQASIFEIVFDLDILYGLHPIQACFIGVEYAKIIKNLPGYEISKPRKPHNFSQYLTRRYGKYQLYYQNRQGQFGYLDTTTNLVFLLDPEDIALSEVLISEFDAPQAFYIGIQAGLKNNPPAKNLIQFKPNLRVIK